MVKKVKNDEGEKFFGGTLTESESLFTTTMMGVISACPIDEFKKIGLLLSVIRIYAMSIGCIKKDYDYMKKVFNNPESFPEGFGEDLIEKHKKMFWESVEEEDI